MFCQKMTFAHVQEQISKDVRRMVKKRLELNKVSHFRKQLLL